MNSIIPYLVVITAMMHSSSSTSVTAPLTRWSVTVINQLSPGHTLFLHCKSKDDDLSYQTLKEDESFSWEFKENLFSSTLYWCTLRTSSNKHVTMEVFWPEKHDWLGYRCGYENCIWDAKDDGVYLENLPKDSIELVRKWQN